jgi:hypothetical protein
MSDDYTSERAAYPRSVQVAGLFWIGFGCLILLNAAAGLVLTFAAGPNQGNAMGGVCSAGCSGLFAVAFLVVGVQTIKGTARDTLGNGIGSIGIGVLNMGAGGIMIAIAMSGAAQTAGFATIAGGISILGGIGLVVAGILALIGRSSYREWREENYPSTVRAEGRRRRKRRRRRDDDEDEPEE